MAKAKDPKASLEVETGTSGAPSGSLGSDDSSIPGTVRLQDETRDTPKWVEEALAWIKKEREDREEKIRLALDFAGTWAQQGYLETSMNSLRKASYLAGEENAFMLAAMRLMEGQQGLR